MNTFDLTNVKQKDPVLEIKEEKNEDQPSKSNSTTSRSPTNKSNNKNNNFKSHNYANIDFTKYHNQSKDILYIAKRLQQVNNYGRNTNVRVFQYNYNVFENNVNNLIAFLWYK